MRDLCSLALGILLGCSASDASSHSSKQYQRASEEIGLLSGIGRGALKKLVEPYKRRKHKQRRDN